MISLRLHTICSQCDTAQFGTNVLKLHDSDQRRLNNIDRLSTVNCADAVYVQCVTVGERMTVGQFTVHSDSLYTYLSACMFVFLMPAGQPPPPACLNYIYILSPSFSPSISFLLLPMIVFLTLSLSLSLSLSLYPPPLPPPLFRSPSISFSALSCIRLLHTNTHTGKTHTHALAPTHAHKRSHSAGAFFVPTKVVVPHGKRQGNFCCAVQLHSQCILEYERQRSIGHSSGLAATGHSRHCEINAQCYSTGSHPPKHLFNYQSVGAMANILGKPIM